MEGKRCVNDISLLVLVDVRLANGASGVLGFGPNYALWDATLISYALEMEGHHDPR
jgi:hypothetical protein